MAKGFQRTPEIDYSETFSLVIEIATIRVVFSVVAHFDWIIEKKKLIILFPKWLIKGDCLYAST